MGGPTKAVRERDGARPDAYGGSGGIWRRGAGEAAPFAGRGDEIEWLHAVLGEAIAGRGRLVLLAGERGVGKTRMAMEFAGQAKHRGVAVLWARCAEEAEASRFEPWSQILQQCARGIDEGLLQRLTADAAPELAEMVAPAVGARLPDQSVLRAAKPAPFFHLFDGIVRVIENEARQAPQLTVLDDLHWADSASILFLQFLTRQIGELPLMILAAYREDELGNGHPLADALAELGRVPATGHLDLHGLGAEEIGELVAARTGAELPARVVSTLHQCTGGSPLLLVELLRAAGLKGLWDLSENGLRIVPVTPAIHDAVSRRFARLSKPCRQTLRVAAVIGDRFSAALVAALVAESEDGARRAVPPADGGRRSTKAFLDEGVAAGVLRPGGEAPGCYRFSDWFTMNMLRQELPGAQRVRLQHSLTRLIERREVAVPRVGELMPAGAAGVGEGKGEGPSPAPRGSLSSVSGGGGVEARRLVAEPDRGEATAAPGRAGVLRQEGDFWAIGFGATTGRLKASKGLFYLSQLLRHPRRDFLAVELAAAASGGPMLDTANGGSLEFATRPAVLVKAEPVIDAAAHAACRARLDDLREDLAEAEEHHDLGRADRLRGEIDQLLSRWQESVGLSGRVRGTPSPMERARSAVTKRIRLEIQRIYEIDSGLGRHLAATIVTGRVCSYEPDRDAAVVWKL